VTYASRSEACCWERFFTFGARVVLRASVGRTRAAEPQIDHPEQRREALWIRLPVEVAVRSVGEQES
jgi:hypothetical protein